MENLQTETPHKLAELAKCAHPGCICTVESGDDECNCGHPECAAMTSRQLPPVGREAS
jgi:hypothetical protein